MKLKLKKNDEVIVIAGSNKGKIGRIIRTDFKTNRAYVKDINVVTKHVKPSQSNTEGSIKNMEAPIHISNLAIVTKKASKSSSAQYSKIGFKVSGKTKVRIARKTKKEIK
ncbi:50S ribosomal protein L24 [Mycoplasmopsis caviae]|uniref:Large ribosomal subunit protein uL24 n=1 Tax=Mycoplasmopsis caviae TaxID=55603 RepID=A0A3P8KXF4_9BACT|nr:50S ribosomal protein L24 [Mycoplasmopsis caviae]UUD34866.1 50S ribosomal protein L24 [Mycoplasmopsis caviae]VDR42287.1 50S ribosomal protein L24 [Mycoplasmopsis caviae]